MAISGAQACRAFGRAASLVLSAGLCVVVVAGCTSGSTADRPTTGPSAAGSSPASGSASAAGARAPLRKAATTPVKPPVAGNIHQTVRPVPVTTRAPVSLHAPAAFGDGVTARIVSSRAIHVQAVGPGQVSGPGVNLVVEVTNHSTKAIDLGAAVVTVADARGTPGVLMVYAPETTADADVPAVPSDSFSHPMTGSLAPNATARGTYVFTVPAEHRNPLTVHVSYAGDSPVVVFAGNLS